MLGDWAPGASYPDFFLKNWCNLVHSEHSKYPSLFCRYFENKNERAIPRNLRICAHKPAIEGGRYLNIPKHERICTACNTGK